MEKETLQAKLRNQLSPIYSLAQMVLLMNEKPEIKDLIIQQAEQTIKNQKEIDSLLKEIEEQTDWVSINPNNLDSYPKEGYTVLVTDGRHYDVAYYVRSQTYQWFKEKIGKDHAFEFSDFNIQKWRYINQEDIDKQQLPTRKVCFFSLKNNKYLTENGIEITTEMLVKYPHQITEHWSYIILD